MFGGQLTSASPQDGAARRYVAAFLAAAAGRRFLGLAAHRLGPAAADGRNRQLRPTAGRLLQRTPAGEWLWFPVITWTSQRWCYLTPPADLLQV